ncbi:hypothetical protein T484DRAFT_1894602, partial [Baffinella frigidus]
MFEYVVPVRLLAFRPGRVLVGMAVTLTVSGENFRCGDREQMFCRTGGRAPAFGVTVCLDSETLICRFTSLPAGNHSLSVSSDDVAFVPFSNTLEVGEHAQILSVSPGFGALTGGSNTTITVQEGLDQVPEVLCHFGDSATVGIPTSPSHISCPVPPVDSQGPVQLWLTSEQSLYKTHPATFEYVAHFRVAAIRPSVGLSARATTDTRAVSGSSSLIRCLAPPQPPGAVSVDVSFPGGELVATGLAFMYVDQPEIEGVIPSVASGYGGELVTVLGAGFADSDQLACRFGASPASSTTFISPSEIHCVAPVLHTLSDTFLEVSNTESEAGPRAVFEIHSSGALVKMSPAVGGGDGGVLVSFSGQGLGTGGAIICMFGSAIIPAVAQSANQVQCVTPAHPHGGVVEVQVPRMSITALIPSSGPTSGGTAVTAVGALHLGAAAFCRVARGSAVGRLELPDSGELADGITTEMVDCQMLSSSSVRLITPPATGPASVLIEVSRVALFDVKSSARFSYTRLITIIRSSPDSGLDIGGTRVSLIVDDIPEFPAGGLKCRFSRAVSVAAVRVSREAVSCVAPAFHPGNVTVSLTTAADEPLSNAVYFQYTPVATAIRLTPSKGKTQGGTAVVLIGPFQPSGGEVWCDFGGRVVLAETTGVDSGGVQLVCVSPRGQGVVAFNLWSSEGGGASSAGLLFEYEDTVLLAALVPSSGPAGGGTVVQITGSGFKQVVACKFGGDGAPVVGEYVSETMVACRAPAGRAGDVMVQVSTDGETFSSGRHVFSYVERELVTLVKPSAVALSGRTQVTVVGEHFAASERSACKFGSAVVTGTVVSSSAMLCVSPEQRLGDVAVEVSSNGVDFSHDGVTVQYTQLAVVYSVEPSAGLEEGGTVVTVTGANVGSSGPGKTFTCLFGLKKVVGEIASASSVVCTSPAHLSGKVGLGVSIDGVTGYGEGVSFEYVRRARVTRVWPSVGRTEGSTSLRVFGTDFGVGKWSCRFGSAGVSKAQQVSVSELACMSPRHDVGGDVVVGVALEGGEFSEDEAVFRYTSAPVVSSVTPSYTSVEGGTEVTIKGRNLGAGGGDVWVRFGSGEAVLGWYVESADAVLCMAPASGSLGDSSVELSFNGVEFSSSAVYLSRQVQTLDLETEPSSGFVSGGNTITVSGSGFSPTPETSLWCEFSAKGWSQVVAAESRAPRTVECITPSHGLGLVSVSIVEGSVSSQALGTAEFEYIADVEVMAVIPSFGAQGGGTLVSVIGASFSGESVSCSFGAMGSVSAMLVSSSLLLCSSPTVSEVSTSHTDGSVEVQVSNNGVDYSSTGARFSFVADVHVDGISPGSVSAGDTMIGVYGGGFMSSESLRCRLGSNQHVAARYISSSHVTCSTSSLRRGNYSVSVTFNGADFYSGAFELEATDVVEIERIIPSTGPVGGGATIRIITSGAVPSGKVECRFGDVQTAGSHVSESEISCVSPAGQAGTVDVQLVLGTEVGRVSVPFVYYSGSSASVSSVHPCVGGVGGGLSVLVTGSNLRVSGGACRVDGLVVEAAEVISSTMQSCVIPSHAAGRVFIEAMGDDGAYTEPGAIFQYSELPRVSSVTPTVVTDTGRSLVTVSGEHFVDSSSFACAFGSEEGMVTSGAVISSSTAICNVPASRAGVHSLTTSNNGVEFSTSRVLLNVVGTKSILSVTPSQGSRTGGTLVTVVGVNFDSSTACAVGTDVSVSRAMVTSFVSSSLITCVTPAVDTIGAVSLRAKSAGVDWVDSSGATFDFTGNAILTGVHPSRGSVSGGTIVSVVGMHWSTADVTCRIGETSPRQGVALSSTLVLCVAPKVSAVGEVAVGVSNNGVDFVSKPGTFVYTDQVEITGVFPTVGSSSGGAYVTVVGSHFPQTSSLECRFGSTREGESAGSWQSSTLVKCVTPSGHVGNVTVSVMESGRVLSTSAQTFSFLPVHTVSSLTPSTGDEAGGAAVTVQGSGFDTGLLSLMCVFGDTQHSAEVLSSSTVVCTLPSQAAGAVVFKLCQQGGDTCTWTGLRFVYTARPVVEGLLPSIGHVGGGSSVTVLGSGFHASSAMCKFGGDEEESGDVTWISSSLIVCTSPMRAQGISAVQVANGLGGAVSLSSMAFAFVELPVVSRIVPSMSSTMSGVSLTIYGEHFFASEAASCRFGTKLAKALVVSSSKALCSSPAITAGGDVRVEFSSNGAEFSTSSATFRLQEWLEVVSMTPSVGGTSGNTVVSVSVVGKEFEATKGFLCMFGDTEVVDASFVSSQLIKCVAPAHSAGEVVMRVAMSGEETSAIAGRFKFVNALTVEYVRPSVGWLGGRGTVLVHGTGFGDAGMHCNFADHGKSSAEVLSSTLLRCVAPALVTADVARFEVTSNDGISSGAGVNFEFRSEPLLQQVWPSSGSVAGGTIVGLTFSGLHGNESVTCYFGDQPATGVMISSKYVSCVAPRALGPVNVSVGVECDGVAVHASGWEFSYENSGIVLAMQPRTGPTSGNTKITLEGQNLRRYKALACVIGAVKVDAWAVSGDSVVCVSPQHSRGAAVVHLFNGTMLLTADGLIYEYEDDVQVINVLPGAGSAQGGTSVTVHGTGFRVTDQAMCRFGDQAVTAIVTSGMSLICVSPSSTVHDAVVAVSMNGVDFSSVGGSTFRFLEDPLVLRIEPSSGDSMRSIRVTLHGDNFVASEYLSVRFNGAVTSGCVVLSSSLMVVNVPRLQSGDYRVEASVDGWNYVGGDTIFEVLTSPVIGSVNPSASDLTGGSYVVVEGSNLHSAEYVWCLFGDKGTHAERINGSALSCETPIMPSAGTVRFGVRTGAGDFYSDEVEFQFSALEVLELAGVHPSIGSVSGGTSVILQVVGLEADSLVSCVFSDGETPISKEATRVGSNQLRCTTPALSEGMAKISLSTSARREGSNTVTFRYFSSPVLSSVVPDVGTGLSGETLTLRGSGFSDAEGSWCMLGTTEHRLMVTSSSEIVCTMKTLGEGNYSVGVKMGGIVYPLGGAEYRVKAAVQVSSVVPSAASTYGGDMVTVSGSGFDGSEAISCVFGGVYSLATFISANEIRCSTPMGLVGSLDLSIASGHGVDEDPLTFGGRIVNVGAFTFDTSIAVVLHLNPSKGIPAGGSTLEVIGLGFDSKENKCVFDGAMGGTIETVSSTMIRCVTPPHVASVVEVQVEVGGGRMSVTGKPFEYVEAPVLDKLVPSAGPCHVPATVTVIGQNFVNSPDMACTYENSEGQATSVPTLFVSSSAVIC